MKLGSGAEAVLFKEKNIVIKNRFPKSYRLLQLDLSLRKSRTKRESKILKKLEDLKFPAPKLIKNDDSIIEMSFIPGDKVRDVLEKTPEIWKEIGKKIGILHKNKIIHGDLTTSNMIFDDEVYFIDFGLSFFSEKEEDMAVDLHVLEKALQATHHTIWKECLSKIHEGYKCLNKNKLVFSRLETVRSRGRNKNKH